MMSILIIVMPCERWITIAREADELKGEVNDLTRRMLFLTGFVLLSLLMFACQPATDGTNGNVPETGGTLPAVGETGECANIAADTLVQTGNDVYSTRCASCHGGQGEGSGTFPGLAGIESLNASDAATTLQSFFDPEVHPFIDDITNMDVAAVLSYVRGAFGNDAPVVCPEHVEAVRPGP